MSSNLPYDPYRVRHISAHGPVIEQWAIGLEQDDAFAIDALDMQINPQQVLGMVSLATHDRIQFKVLVLTEQGSPTAEERARAAGAEQGGQMAVYEAGIFPRRVVEAALAQVAPRGRWPILVQREDGETQFSSSYQARLHEEQRYRWVLAVNRLFGTQFDLGQDAVVGWGVANA